MAIYRKLQSEDAEVIVPTRADWNLGLCLVLLGVTLMGLVPVLRGVGFAAGSLWNVSMLLAAAGLFLIRFSCKRYRISPERILIRDGYFSPPRVYEVDGMPSLRLREQEEQVSGKAVMASLVILSVDKVHHVLDHRAGNSLESRSLAEALARALQCALIEDSEEGEEQLSSHDVGLSFGERARLHPSLVGRQIEQPGHCRVSLQETNGTQVYRWKLMSQSLFFDFVSLVLIVCAVAVLPLFSGESEIKYSFLDLARREGQVTYFIVTGLFLMALGFVPIAGSRKLVATPEGLTVHKRLLGLCVSEQHIPSGHLSEIWVGRGAYLYFLSDQSQLGCGVPTQPTAAWMASRLRRFYAH